MSEQFIYGFLTGIGFTVGFGIAALVIREVSDRRKRAQEWTEHLRHVRTVESLGEWLPLVAESQRSVYGDN